MIRSVLKATEEGNPNSTPPVWQTMQKFTNEKEGGGGRGLKAAEIASAGQIDMRPMSWSAALKER